MSKATFRSLTISAGPGRRILDQETGEHRRRYQVRVASDGTGRTVRFAFTDSIANERAGKVGLGPVELLWAFRCFVDDAEFGSIGFGDFCSDLGVDPDSRSAHADWTACRRAAAKLAVLFHSPVEPSTLLAELTEAGVE